MIKKLSFAVIAAMAVSSFSVAAPFPTLNTGLWEISSEILTPSVPKILGMPAKPWQKPKTSKQTQCITNSNLIPDFSRKGQDCRILSKKIAGNTVSWVMDCTKGTMTTKSRGEITYLKNSLTGRISMSLNSQNQQSAMEMTSIIKGHRIGDCPK